MPPRCRFFGRSSWRVIIGLSWLLKQQRTGTQPAGGPSAPSAAGKWSAWPRASVPRAETWGHIDSLFDHFARHGGDFHARNAWSDYAAQAAAFLARAKAGFGLPAKRDGDVFVARLAISGDREALRSLQCEWHDPHLLQAREPGLLRAPAGSARRPAQGTVKHLCPVCGWPELTQPPRQASGGASFEICPCCGFEFVAGTTTTVDSPTIKLASSGSVPG